MKTITVENIPDYVYLWLEESSKQDNSSINTKILDLLKSSVPPDTKRILTPTELMKLPAEQRYKYLEECVSKHGNVYNENPDLMIEDNEDIIEYES
jgi:hypothetical protein